MIAWAWHRNEPYPQRLFRQLRSAPRDPALDERHARFVGLNVFVTERNAWITSVPGDTEVRMECLVDSTLPDEAAKLGYRLEPIGTGERILPHSIVEKFTRNADGELVPLTPGSTAKVATTVTHAGIVTTERYEFEMGTPEANPTMRIR